jgi:acyl transferase domain-containing protein
MVVNADGVAHEATQTERSPLPGAPQSLDHLVSLANAWVNGNPVDLGSTIDQRRFMRVGIPQYPFESNKYWCRDEFETLFYETFGESQAELHSSNRKATR